MTVIATFVMDDKRYVACDTAVGDEHSQFQCTTKLWKPFPGLVVGFAGDAGITSRVMYGSKVDPQFDKKMSVEQLYQQLVEPAQEMTKDSSDDKYADMLIVTKARIFYADTKGMLDTVRQNDFAIGSGGDAARIFMNFKSNFSDPAVFTKCMMQAISDVCPTVSSQCVLELVP